MAISGGLFMSWPDGVGCGVGRSVADMGRVVAFQPPPGERASSAIRAELQLFLRKSSSSCRRWGHRAAEAFRMVDIVSLERERRG